MVLVLVTITGQKSSYDLSGYLLNLDTLTVVFMGMNLASCPLIFPVLMQTKGQTHVNFLHVKLVDQFLSVRISIKINKLVFKLERTNTHFTGLEYHL